MIKLWVGSFGLAADFKFITSGIFFVYQIVSWCQFRAAVVAVCKNNATRNRCKDLTVCLPIVTSHYASIEIVDFRPAAFGGE